LDFLNGGTVQKTITIPLPDHQKCDMSIRLDTVLALDAQTDRRNW